MRGSPGSSQSARSASARVWNFFTGISVPEAEFFLEPLRVGLVLEADRVALHRVQGLGGRHHDLPVTVDVHARLQVAEGERLEASPYVDARVIGCDVLH